MCEGVPMSFTRHLIAIGNLARALTQSVMRKRRAQMITTATACVVVSFVYLRVLGSQSPLN